MYRNDAATAGAPGLLFLRRQERCYAFFFYLLKICHETCPVTFIVPLLQALHAFTWQISAVTAGFKLVLGEFLASPFDEAVFAS